METAVDSVLYRKIAGTIEEHLRSKRKQVLLINGARQVGKTYIVRYIGKKLYKNFIEINMVEDATGEQMFSGVRTVEDFYMRMSMKAGHLMGNRDDTLVFLDEIQACPQFLTLLKFLAEDGRFTFIAGGTHLGDSLARTTSVPMGSIRTLRMFHLDFEEFLYANGMNGAAISAFRGKFLQREALDETMHRKLLDLFKKYLLVGGMPDAVDSFLETQNIQRIRGIQNRIHDLYAADASGYGEAHKLKTRRVYDLIPSNMGNKKKRMIAKEIEGKKGKTFHDYQDEFEYLISAGIALNVQAISAPRFPLAETEGKNLLKLYLNDVGILSGILYGNNIRAIMEDNRSVALGSLYETAVAGELASHGYNLFYCENREKGEVDFLIDDYPGLSVVPLEIRSGRGYRIHSAIRNLVSSDDYPVREAFVLSNERQIYKKGRITYLPVYFIMFFRKEMPDESSMLLL